MRKRRGIVLVISIVLAVVILMFVGAALTLGPAALGMGQGTIQGDEAQRAAESGVSYVLAQLRQNPSWKGDGNTVTVNEPDLYVEEHNGNVVGLVRAPGGGWSQFRLRFNYNDGSGGADDLDNSNLAIDIPFVSFNNLETGVASPVPRADGPGFSVTPGSEIAFEAPVWSVSLAVEGRAGPACNVLSPADPNPPLGAAKRKVVEVLCQVPDMGPLVEQSGSMSGSDFTVLLRPDGSGKVEVISESEASPRVRAKGLASVTGGDMSENYVSADGEVRSSDGQLTANYDSTKVTVTGEAVIDPFYQLAWADVKKATPTGPTVPGGTYVWWDDGSLHYYDLSYTDYVAFISDPLNSLDPGVSPPPLPPEMLMDPDNKKLTLTSSIYVEPTASTGELNILPRLGAPEAPPGDPEAESGTGAVVTYLAQNPAILLSGAPGIGNGGGFGIEYLGTRTDIARWDWSSGSFTTENYNMEAAAGVTREQVIEFIADPSTQPGWQIDTNGLNWNQPTQAPDLVAIGQAQGIGGGADGNGEIPVPGVADSLSAADLEIEFDPPEGSLAVLTGEDNMRLTGAVTGKDGSITSGGDIRVTGLGAQFETNEQSGVNMYAQGDIVFSTLDQTSPGVFEYRDVNLKGVIYAQGDFIAKLGSEALTGQWGKLTIQGCLVAYGGDPAGEPGVNGGLIDLRAEEVKLAFDPVYLGALSANLPADFRLVPISWNNNL